MKIKMIPTLESGGSQPSGISRVVEAYYKYLPGYGVEFVEEGEDLKVVHAGITGSDCDVAILHGLYFTEDYQASGYEYKANQNITDAVRATRRITVPSQWVGEIIRRDLRIVPDVIPHGIEWSEWQEKADNRGYVLYNKNRDGVDVCNSDSIVQLAKLRPGVRFLTTFARNALSNIEVIGVKPHTEMKKLVQSSLVYTSLTKETFGIGTLEAMASGVPVLGFRFGGNIDIVEHGVTGYLASPYDFDDLANGLDYCIKYRDVLGENAREIAKKWTWEKAVQKLYKVLEETANARYKYTISVIIPSYNYANKVGRAVQSCVKQTLKPDEIIVVDDGSTDNTEEVVGKLISDNPDSKIIYKKKNNGGVADARNYGFECSTSEYICCLDADDEIKPNYLLTCMNFLKENRGISLTYTGLEYEKDGIATLSQWPPQCNFDSQVKRKNQIPTCNLSHRYVWERLGGQRQRYAPMGAGSEDADMWTRMGAYGMVAAKCTEEGLFLYHGGGRTTQREYREIDWLAWHPWVVDKRYPFACAASPERMSHPVRQYDQPIISVIIPVGKGHEKQIVNALDSLDAQTLRKWEAIVVWDSPNEIPKIVSDAFPHVFFVHTDKSESGPGVARNLGVKYARAGLILFLDADDYLNPGKSLEIMYMEWRRTDSIIYSDYLGVSMTTKDELHKFGDRVISFNPRTNEVLSRFRASPYDCDLAQRQPDEQLYHWCLVTCLIPKKLHMAIGGFDESMNSWEDVDYHWRMARGGVCYTHVAEPLIVYQFTTGTRRELASAYNNKEMGLSLIKYMKEKYKGEKTMPCRGCGGGQSRIGVDHVEVKSLIRQPISDSDVVMVRLDDGNIGDHAVFGPVSRTNYGYRSSGETFLIKRIDYEAAPHIYTPLGADLDSSQRVPVDVPKPIVEPVKVQAMEANRMNILRSDQSPVLDVPAIAPFDPQTIPGVSEAIAKRLVEIYHVRSKADIRMMGRDKLLEVEGIGERRADVIMKAVEDAV